MESRIRVRASADEMRDWFEKDSVKYYERVSPGLYKVIYRHAELDKPLTGTFTIEGLLKKIEERRTDK